MESNTNYHMTQLSAARTVLHDAGVSLQTQGNAMHYDSEFVRDVVAAKILDTSVQTLRRWRQEDRHLRYYKIGASVRYRISELYEFLASHAVEARW